MLSNYFGCCQAAINQLQRFDHTVTLVTFHLKVMFSENIYKKGNVFRNWFRGHKRYLI